MPRPEVSTTDSAGYEWRSCGRIASAAGAVASVFAKDGGVLSIDETGVLRRFAPETSSGVRLATIQSASQLRLVADGTRLIASGSTRATVLEASDGGAIASGALDERAAIDLQASECLGPTEASLDGSRLVAQGEERACVWNADDGSLFASLPLGARQETPGPTLVGLTPDGDALVLFRDASLTTYALDGQASSSTPTSRVDLHATLKDASYIQAQLSADSKSLVLRYATDQGQILIAIDTATGAELWRRVPATEYGQLEISDGYVLITGDSIYRLEDGAPSHAALGLRGPIDVSADGRRIVETTRVVRVWDLEQEQISRLYGGGQSFTSLDMTPDGRFLAAGGFPSLAWRVAANFSESEPLFDAGAEGAFQVSISPLGDSLLLSGDVVALARRDGSMTFLANDTTNEPVHLPFCLSNHWDFSPNGCTIAGFRYTSDLQVLDTGTLQTRKLGLASCSSVAFSPEGARLMTADLDLLDTTSWMTIRTSPGRAQPANMDETSSITYSPNGREVAVTRCRGTRDNCQSSIYDAESGDAVTNLPFKTGGAVSYSPEGHWLLAGNTLLHLPSGELRTLEASESGPALFTPEGDVIVSGNDGSLLRFCRSRIAI